MEKAKRAVRPYILTDKFNVDAKLNVGNGCEFESLAALMAVESLIESGMYVTNIDTAITYKIMGNIGAYTAQIQDFIKVGTAETNTYLTKENIPAANRWEGLHVFDEDTKITWVLIGGVADGDYKVFYNGVGKLNYTAFISQTGTNAPTDTVLEDTIGGSWARTAAGTYTHTKTGAFVEDKTSPGSTIQVAYDDDGNKMTAQWIDEDTIQVITYAESDLETPADDILSDTEFRIEVFQ